MEKLLVINAHPKVEDTSSASLQVPQHFLETYRKLNPEGPIEQIDLYRDFVPGLDHTVLQAWEKMKHNESRASAVQDELTIEERRSTSRMSDILRQFKSAKKYVITMPLHNFNIPSKLKDYMDNILIAKETFAYTANGSVGLLTDNRSLLVIQASGAICTNNDWYTEVEYSHKYLKSMFNFMGVKKYQIIRAQGVAKLNRSDVLAQAFEEAELAAVSFTEVQH